MTWQVIARLDGSRTADTRSVKLLLGLTVFAVLLAAYIYPLVAPEPITTARFAGYVSGWLAMLLPFVGIVISYAAVVTERESGSLLLSLSLPHDRRDLVIGKAAARGGVLAAAIVVAMAGAGFLVVYPFGELEALRFLAFVLLTVAFGAIWTNLGVAVSVAVSTKTRAFVLVFGLLVLFLFVWDTMAAALEFGLNAADLIDGDLPEPVQFLFALEPGRVFGRVIDGFIDPSASGDGPWYMNEWVALIVFGCWFAGPLSVAHRFFAGRDLA